MLNKTKEVREKILQFQIQDHLKTSTIKQNTTKIANGEVLKIKITQTSGESCKLTAFTCGEMLKILETSFGHRSIARVNYSNKSV